MKVTPEQANLALRNIIREFYQLQDGVLIKKKEE